MNAKSESEWTAGQYVIDAGWDNSAVEATAKNGVAEDDAADLTAEQVEELLAYCLAKALVSRAVAAKTTIEEDATLSLYSEAGANGIFFPLTDTECAYARYWTDENYSWSEMVDDITDEAIKDGEARTIVDSDSRALIDAAIEFGDDAILDTVLAAVRKRCYAADMPENHGDRQATCDAVDWEDVDGDVLEYLTGDLADEDLDEATVAELERLAKQCR